MNIQFGRFCGYCGSAVIIFLGTFAPLDVLDAQLVECQQVGQAMNPTTAGGCIDKPLAQQIGAGHADAYTAGSSSYLIVRDPARSIRRGRQLFQRKFTLAEGLGPRVNTHSSGAITEMRALGAGLADSCAACHGRPRGAAGFGGDVNTFPDSRDAPHLFGLGLVEMLADEVTRDLRAIRDAAIAEAGDSSTLSSTSSTRDGRFRRSRSGRSRRSGRGEPRGDGGVTRRLTSKGLDFGSITAYSDGRVDTSRVRGIDADLRVKPFFHDGRTATMREFIIGAFNDEMGLQAWDPILCGVTDGPGSPAMTSPAGFVFDPALDDFSRPPACDWSEDVDGDGVYGEIDPALVDHMEFYLLNYFKPGRYRVSARASDGLTLMDDIGCTSCHVKDLTIDNDRRVADVETVYDPAQGIYNDLFATASTRFTIVPDNPYPPKLLPEGEPFVVENIFTDLKRHDLGPEFEERDFDGSRIREHVTEPLWGVGNSAPYGHDGRSINLDTVIRRHGGEASAVTSAYLALDEDSRDKIIDFLETLILFPPDDTASNLNPGNPFGDPQNPADHGSINLGALFQIAGEGGE